MSSNKYPACLVHPGKHCENFSISHSLSQKPLVCINCIVQGNLDYTELISIDNIRTSISKISTMIHPNWLPLGWNQQFLINQINIKQNEDGIKIETLNQLFEDLQKKFLSAFEAQKKALFEKYLGPYQTFQKVYSEISQINELNAIFELQDSTEANRKLAELINQQKIYQKNNIDILKSELEKYQKAVEQSPSKINSQQTTTGLIRSITNEIQEIFLKIDFFEKQQPILQQQCQQQDQKACAAIPKIPKIPKINSPQLLQSLAEKSQEVIIIQSPQPSQSSNDSNNKLGWISPKRKPSLQSRMYATVGVASNSSDIFEEKQSKMITSARNPTLKTEEITQNTERNNKQNLLINPQNTTTNQIQVNNNNPFILNKQPSYSLHQNSIQKEIITQPQQQQQQQWQQQQQQQQLVKQQSFHLKSSQMPMILGAKPQYQPSQSIQQKQEQQTQQNNSIQKSPQYQQLNRMTQSRRESQLTSATNLNSSLSQSFSQQDVGPLSQRNLPIQQGIGNNLSYRSNPILVKPQANIIQQVVDQQKQKAQGQASQAYIKWPQ